MRCKLPDQDTGTIRLYIADAMGDEYKPPGVEVQTTDSGVRYLRVTKDVGERLIDRHGYEELTDDSTTSEETDE